MVHFAYIDEGADSLAGFETFLRQYHPLFVALKAFEVIYIAAESRWVEKAERLFRRFYPQDGSTTLSRPEPEHGRMVKYFDWRHKFEQRDFSDMTTEIIIHLRNERKHFAGEKFEALYKLWLSGGEAALRSRASADQRLNSLFRTLILTHDYELFGSPRRVA